MIRKILTTAFGVSLCGAALAETIKLDDGTTCTIIESTSVTDAGNSTTVTAGGGKVSSSTRVGGKPTTTHSAGGSTSGASATASGDGTTSALSTSSITRPDGAVVTRNSDGTCYVEKAKP
nr:MULTISPECIES: hypothetical protein [unclassified Rhizobium]